MAHVDVLADRPDGTALLEEATIRSCLGAGSNACVLCCVFPEPAETHTLTHTLTHTGTHPASGAQAPPGASDVPRGHKVAVKVMSHFWDLNAKRLLDCERATLRALPPHPNVVRVHAEFKARVPEAFRPFLNHDMATAAADTNAGYTTQVFVQEFHPVTLDTYRFALPCPMPWFVLWQLARDLVAGVVHMERHRVMHLDFKLDNVLVAYDGRAVLTDFGISRVFSSQEMTLEYREPFDLLMNRLVLAPEVLQQHDAARAELRAWRRARELASPRSQAFAGVPPTGFASSKDDGRASGSGAAAMPMPASPSKADAVDAPPVRSISFASQGVWSAGAVLYELAAGYGHEPTYPEDGGGVSALSYSVSNLPPLPILWDARTDSAFRRANLTDAAGGGSLRSLHERPRAVTEEPAGRRGLPGRNPHSSTEEESSGASLRENHRRGDSDEAWTSHEDTDHSVSKCERVDEPLPASEAAAGGSMFRRRRDGIWLFGVRGATSMAYPFEFCSLVMSMLHADPSQRISAEAALLALDSMRPIYVPEGSDAERAVVHMRDRHMLPTVVPARHMRVRLPDNSCVDMPLTRGVLRWSDDRAMLGSALPENLSAASPPPPDGVTEQAAAPVYAVLLRQPSGHARILLAEENVQLAALLDYWEHGLGYQVMTTLPAEAEHAGDASPEGSPALLSPARSEQQASGAAATSARSERTQFRVDSMATVSTGASYSPCYSGTVGSPASTTTISEASVESLRTCEAQLAHAHRRLGSDAIPAFPALPRPGAPMVVHSSTASEALNTAPDLSRHRIFMGGCELTRVAAVGSLMRYWQHTTRYADDAAQPASSSRWATAIVLDVLPPAGDTLQRSAANILRAADAAQHDMACDDPTQLSALVTTQRRGKGSPSTAKRSAAAFTQTSHLLRPLPAPLMPSVMLMPHQRTRSRSDNVSQRVGAKASLGNQVSLRCAAAPLTDAVVFQYLRDYVTPHMPSRTTSGSGAGHEARAWAARAIDMCEAVLYRCTLGLTSLCNAALKDTSSAFPFVAASRLAVVTARRYPTRHEVVAACLGLFRNLTCTEDLETARGMLEAGAVDVCMAVYFGDWAKAESSPAPRVHTAARSSRSPADGDRRTRTGSGQDTARSSRSARSSAGGSPTASRGSRIHGQDARLAEDAILSVSNLLRFDELQTTAVPVKLIASMAVDAMRRHGAVTLVQDCSARLFRYLLGIGTDDVAVAVASVGAVDTLTAALISCASDRAVVENILHVICSLLIHESNRHPAICPVKLCASNVVSVMSRSEYLDDGSVQGLAATVLRNLACVSSDGWTPTMKLSAGSTAAANDGRAGTVRSSDALSPALLIAACGAPAALEAAMERHPTNSTIQENGRCALYNLLLIGAQDAKAMMEAVAELQSESEVLKDRIKALSVLAHVRSPATPINIIEPFPSPRSVGSLSSRSQRRTSDARSHTIAASPVASSVLALPGSPMHHSDSLPEFVAPGSHGISAIAEASRSTDSGPVAPTPSPPNLLPMQPIVRIDVSASMSAVHREPDASSAGAARMVRGASSLLRQIARAITLPTGTTAPAAAALGTNGLSADDVHVRVAPVSADGRLTADVVTSPRGMAAQERRADLWRWSCGVVTILLLGAIAAAIVGFVL